MICGKECLDLLYDYFEGEQSNIFTRCQQALKGHNENEVLLVPKTSKSMV